MFTGIVDHCGRLELVEPTRAGVAWEVSTSFADLTLGESIAMDGVCLTVTHFTPGRFRCELSPETLEKTAAREFKVGKQINLERALRLSDRLGGHMVTGHVDGVVKLLERDEQGDFCRMVFGPIPAASMGLVLEKGSIALNGVSLTLNRVQDDRVEVMLIPHTLERTNLGALETGTHLNVEYDWLAKLVARQLERSRV